MSVVTITKQSHKDPAKFRVKYEDSKAVIGPGHEVRKNEKLPVIETASNVAIIGGGFSGIASAMRCVDKLKETDFVIFEKYDNFGGTWYANTYPGCASDIPALWYSFSNELNTSWS
jgi:heterodisulfide reductase subunit A-like polyferredoxin